MGIESKLILKSSTKNIPMKYISSIIIDERNKVIAVNVIDCISKIIEFLFSCNFDICKEDYSTKFQGEVKNVIETGNISDSGKYFFIAKSLVSYEITL